mgnify:CR=1 FL=1
MWILTPYLPALTSSSCTARCFLRQRGLLIKKISGLKYVHNDTCYPALLVIGQMIDALKSGKVRAAGLDVVSTEPVKSDNPLLHLDNCIITPHISWAAKESRQRIMDITVENVKAFLEGNPIHVVNMGK